MEDTVSSSMGAMGPVLRKLDLLLAPESRLRKRVKDGIGLLKEDLEEVSSALVDLSMECPSARAKCWMNEARELSYHIEDFVDELMLMRTDAGSKIRAASRHRVARAKIALLPAPPRRSTRIAKIAQLRDLLLQANQRFERYRLDDCCSSPKHMNMITQHHRAPALYGDAANLVGIEANRMKLIEMLTGEAEQQLKVVSIVGPAGVGKTTLAKEIFHEVRGQFELRAFVHASRKIDTRRFLGSILSQVQPHHQLPSVAGSVQSLIHIIQEQLQDKRYFIVIDDLWEETAWDIVRGAFPEGNDYSRIVATTENMNVALKCCSYMADNILKMKTLGIQDSGYLFFNRVFGSEQQCPDELKEVSYGIIRKCCGLPLSLVHVAGLLASIDFSEPWYHVHDYLCSILNRSHTAEETQKKILYLSYNNLPHHLKTCLMYFSMYPEGYIMWKGHLVKQWIAEGFINAAGGKDREETAEGYFEELVNRGMVQPMKIDYNDEVMSCTVHHIIFDLINHNSKEEEFIAAIDYSQPITGLSTKAHRLSFRFSSAKYAKQPAKITMSQLRSLGLFGFIKCLPPVVEFKHLQVLVLEFCGSHDRHMSLNLSRICILFQLRYLKISGDVMVELPSQVQRLHYLETLEIDARLSTVPLDIVHLPSLLHLGLRVAIKLPDGIGHIKSLSTLLYFDLICNSEDNIQSLGQLTNLRHLHLTCSAVLSSDHLKRKLIHLAFSLGKLCNLKSLTLTPDALGTAILFNISSGISFHSIFLQRLELLAPICFFSRLPTRFGELHKLRSLKIVVKELHGNDISNISGLPSLTVLSLYVQRALTGTIVFRTMAFRALKYFKFTCGVMCLAFQTGAMPNLQRVKLCFNAHRGKNHNRVLDGIEQLLNLQEVVGRIGVLPGADESDWRVVKLSFEDIIRKHPRCPRFSSRLVDFIEEEYPPLEKFHLRRHEGSSSEHEIVEKACTKDMDKHIDSRSSREFDLPPASGTSYHHKSGSFSRWMNNELPEVADLDIKFSSDAFWSTTEILNVTDGSSIPINKQLDAFVVSPSLSQDQLFSIIDVFPSWAYNGTKTKVLVTGTFFAKKEDVKNYRWSCMFGDAEVSAEVLVDGSLCCYTPVHHSGRVPFYVTCSNRVACSEVLEFEFRDSETSDQHTIGINEMHLHICLDKLLSLQPEEYEKYVLSNGNKSELIDTINSLMLDNNLSNLALPSDEKELSTIRDSNLEKQVKEKLYYWLIHNIHDDGKGPNVLGKKGQGAIHLVAALGYDWAIKPIVSAGVNINFRDIRGWTALHWAASCGREQTVDALIANGAAASALTDPTQQYPYGRTPADLASENGHKGIACFLAESSLTSHLSALTLKESQGSNVEEICGLAAAEDFAEPSSSQIAYVNSQEESLKDSLGAVRKSTQAEAGIVQALRVESFHRKKVTDSGDDDCGLSDERTHSLVSLRDLKPEHGDLHSAVVHIQNKFRGWKQRNMFMIIRQKIVKIQAHVRGHQVRKNFRKVLWSVGIVEKVILRWRRKGRGLRGFQPEKQLEGPSCQIQPAKAEAEDEYEFLKDGRKQAEEKLERALARVRSNQYGQAREQYHRLQAYVNSIKESQVMQDRMLADSAGTDVDDFMAELEELYPDDGDAPMSLF